MPPYNNPPKTSEFFKGKWYNKMVEDLRLAGMADRTVYGYVRAIRKFTKFNQNSPARITENDLRAYLLHQIVDLEVASGSESVLLSGIKSFYRITCPRKWKVLDQIKTNCFIRIRQNTWHRTSIASRSVTTEFFQSTSMV